MTGRRSVMLDWASAVLVGLAAVGVVACAAPEEAGVPIPHARTAAPGVLSAPQPTREQLEAAAGQGYRTVINLRDPAEGGFEWEPALAERVGMRYVSIPVVGAGGLTRANVEAFDAALREGLDHGPVLVHCNSANRNGAMFALRAAWIEGMSPEAALALGKNAGLTRLENAVRERLGMP